MVNLQINQQFGHIGLNIVPFKYDLQIEPLNFQIEQNPAEIRSELSAATLDIDYTRAREAMGYNGIEAQQKTFNAEAKNTSDAGIERRVVEGNQLGDIRTKVSIAQIADRSSQPKEREVQLVSVPSIDINFVPLNMDWNIEIGGVSVESQLGSVQGEFVYGSVSAYMEQNPSLQIKAAGTIFDKQA
jgi:hypothetical protein